MSHGEFWSAASALATIAASLITALSLLFLVIQLREQRRYTLAEFVNQWRLCLRHSINTESARSFEFGRWGAGYLKTD
jgi:hypothetical protein